MLAPIDCGLPRLSALLIIAGLAMQVCLAKDKPIEYAAPAEFTVFNAMLYTDMPAIGTRLAMVYESTFFPNGQADEQELPTTQAIRQAAQAARKQRSDPINARAGFVAIDVERWSVWPFAKGAAHEQSVTRYAKLAQRFRRELAEPICLYGIAPETGINQAVLAKTDRQLLAQWHAASNVTRRLLVPHVDALCPPLYSYYQSSNPAEHRRHLENWQVFARQTIAEARRIASGKPVYVFTWPQYHSGGSVSGYPFVDAQTWRVQLETIKALADGLILWGGWEFQHNKPLPWDDQAPWFRVFRDVFDQ